MEFPRERFNNVVNIVEATINLRILVNVILSDVKFLLFLLYRVNLDKYGISSSTVFQCCQYC
jgi:hypothetical protein